MFNIDIHELKLKVLENYKFTMEDDIKEAMDEYEKSSNSDSTDLKAKLVAVLTNYLGRTCIKRHYKRIKIIRLN